MVQIETADLKIIALNFKQLSNYTEQNRLENRAKPDNLIWMKRR